MSTVVTVRKRNILGRPKALKGSLTLIRLLSIKSDFVQVLVDRGNSVELTVSPNRGLRPGRPSETH